MKRYGDESKNSGVLAYEIGPDFIRVQFHDGDIYRYTYGTAGRENVEEMKKLALKGRGLSTFINQNNPGFIKE